MAIHRRALTSPPVDIQAMIEHSKVSFHTLDRRRIGSFENAPQFIGLQSMKENSTYLPAGSYFLRFDCTYGSGEKQSYTVKLVKVR